LPHAAAEATKAAASETTKAATAASRRIAGMPTHGYDAMREAATAVALEVVALLCAIGDRAHERLAVEGNRATWASASAPVSISHPKRTLGHRSRLERFAKFCQCVSVPTGRRTVNTEPLPVSLVTVHVAARLRVMARPSSVPLSHHEPE